MYEKVVIVTRKTRLEELIERFNTKEQARFYIEHCGGDFQDYLNEEDVYRRSLHEVRKSADVGLKVQVIDRHMLSTFLFSEKDMIVVVGQDGLIANTAKYIGDLPLIGINPDPSRIDGILSPIAVADTHGTINAVIDDTAVYEEITLAEATLNDNQKLLAFNDLFIGAKTHVSARYTIQFGSTSEHHSSSGILVSTGAGSTGWLSSVLNMVRAFEADPGIQEKLHLTWSDPRLCFVVREPFVSRHSSADMVFGLVQSGEELIVESSMPTGGVIFSDGIETDYLEFNSGTTAHIRASDRRCKLVVPPSSKRRTKKRSEQQESENIKRALVELMKGDM